MMKQNGILVRGFTERLEKAITDSKLSLNDICDRTGISRSVLWSYRFQGIMPQSINLMRLALVLGVSTDWLLGLKGEQT